AGGFNESLLWGEDLEMGMRLLETHDIAAVHEPLYFVRRHTERRTAMRLSALRFWWERVAMVRDLVKRGAITYPRKRPYRYSAWQWRGLAMASGLPGAVSFAPEAAGRLVARALRIARRLRRTIAGVFHRSAVRLLSRWPAPGRRSASPRSQPQARVVYLL